MPITIHQGSALEVPADAIVNPANGHLNHGGGLARIIDQAAQRMTSDGGRIPGPIAPNTIHPELRAIHQWRVDHENAPLIATGNAHATSAGMLPFKGVVHAVGPVWNGGVFCERRLLQSAYQEACACAYDHKWRSVVFPAVSCGIFGYPVEKAAPAAIEALRFWADEQPNGVEMDITIALMEDEHVLAFSEALGR